MLFLSIPSRLAGSSCWLSTLYSEVLKAPYALPRESMGQIQGPGWHSQLSSENSIFLSLASRGKKRWGKKRKEKPPKTPNQNHHPHPPNPKSTGQISLLPFSKGTMMSPHDCRHVFEVSCHALILWLLLLACHKTYLPSLHPILIS